MEDAVVRDNFLYGKTKKLAAEKIDIRERISAYGPGAVADYELIAAILGSGIQGKNVRAIAAEIISSCDFTAGVPLVKDLSPIYGLGQARACSLSAAFELGRRFYGSREQLIRSPSDVWQLVRHFDDGKQERFLCCTLNGAHAVIAVHVVTVGLINRSLIHPREVFSLAVADRACAAIVAHNHPSGRLEPSREDKDITDRLKEAGKVLGIEILDHIVFSVDGYLSLVEKGLA